MGTIDPTHSNLNSLYIGLVEDSLTEFVYPAQLGGLHYDLSPASTGIHVNKSPLKIMPRLNCFSFS